MTQSKFLQTGPLIPTSVPHAGPPPAAGQQTLSYEIKGHEMQFVEIALAPGESVVAEAGVMMFKSASVAMETAFGDGSKVSSGFFGKLAAAGRRVMTGESLFITIFENKGHAQDTVAFAAPYPGSIIPFPLADMGGEMICQRDAFLCASRETKVGIFFQKKIMTGLFGGEGFIMQRLTGDGIAFVHVGGSVIERELAPGEVLHVDTGCLAAMTPTISFDIENVGSIKSMVFGGQGMFFAKLVGPGKVWLQSLPFSRLAGRMMASAAGGSHGSTGSSWTSGWSGGGGGSGGDSGGGDSGGGDGGD